MSTSSLNSDIFKSALEFSKGISTVQPKTVMQNNTVSSQESSLASNEILKNPEMRIYHIVMIDQS